MITRKHLPDGHVQVTFHLPDDSGATQVGVAGDFNDWTPESTPMVRTDAGFEATLALTPGRSFRFRYLLDDTRWENDRKADRYVDNDFGGSDSVVDLT